MDMSLATLLSGCMQKLHLCIFVILETCICMRTSLRPDNSPFARPARKPATTDLASRLAALPQFNITAIANKLVSKIQGYCVPFTYNSLITSLIWL